MSKEGTSQKQRETSSESVFHGVDVGESAFTKKERPRARSPPRQEMKEGRSAKDGAVTTAASATEQVRKGSKK